MSQPAVFMIRENGNTAVYRNKYAAICLEESLFAGPEHFARYIKDDFVGTNEFGHIHAVEAFVFVDIAVKNLYFCGGQSLDIDAAYRRLVIEILKQIWCEWEISYIYEVSTITAMLDFEFKGNSILTKSSMIDTVRDKEFIQREVWWEGSVERYATIVSKNSSSLEICLSRLPARYLAYKQVNFLNEHDRWQKSLDIDYEPYSVIHFDVPSRALFYWELDSVDGLKKNIGRLYRSWNIYPIEDSVQYEKIVGSQLKIRRKSTSQIILEEADISWGAILQEGAKNDKGLRLIRHKNLKTALRTLDIDYALVSENLKHQYSE